jgi:hypothetical protein
MIYALLIGGPFLLTWIICSHAGAPTWPAAILSLLAPSLLLANNDFNDHRLCGSLHYPSRILLGLVSLFFGYGSVILATAILALLTPLVFGPTIVTHFPPLLLVGAAISGGLYNAFHRSTLMTHQPRVASSGIDAVGLPVLPSLDP